jgi:hypothetical protein
MDWRGGVSRVLYRVTVFDELIIKFNLRLAIKSCFVGLSSVCTNSSPDVL